MKRQVDRMREYRRCTVCDTLYVATRTDSKTCSKACSKKWNRILSNKSNQKTREQKRLEKQKKMMLDEIAIEARKAGMTYGKYVTKMGL
jgi:hypothetical protein